MGMQPSRAEDCALVSALKALDPAPTDLLLKSPGRSNMSAVGQPRASGGARKVRPSIKALQPEVPPPFTPLPGAPAAVQAAATSEQTTGSFQGVA